MVILQWFRRRGIVPFARRYWIMEMRKRAVAALDTSAWRHQARRPFGGSPGACPMIEARIRLSRCLDQPNGVPDLKDIQLLEAMTPPPPPPPRPSPPQPRPQAQ